MYMWQWKLFTMNSLTVNVCFYSATHMHICVHMHNMCVCVFSGKYWILLVCRKSLYIIQMLYPPFIFLSAAATTKNRWKNRELVYTGCPITIIVMIKKAVIFSINFAFDYNHVPLAITCTISYLYTILPWLILSCLASL